MKRPAVFLDRDGTINELNGYVTTCDQIRILPGAAEGIRIFNKLGFYVLVITNQPVIARGEIGFEELEMIHNHIENELMKKHAIIDGLYFCPHHPEVNTIKPDRKYTKDCNCRKPKIGLIEQAKSDFEIDLTNSWVIGDTWRDLKLAENIGVKYLQIMNSNNLLEREPYMVDSLLNAARKILNLRMRNY
jgi:mannose-1-phosphate guanylyltransferase / phosphomannomutase